MVEDERQPSRCILVLGTGRSGTSAVGGMLYHLGVWMGDGFVQRDATNPWGTFEDAELFFITRQLRSGVARPIAYQKPIEQRNQRPIWGWKDPGLIWTLDHALPYLEDVRAVVCHRPGGQCIQSARKAYNWSKAQAEGWFEAAFDELDAWITELDLRMIPTLHLTWSDVVANPKAAVKELAAFAFEGMEPPDSKQMKRAERHVKRG